MVSVRGVNRVAYHSLTNTNHSGYFYNARQLLQQLEFIHNQSTLSTPICVQGLVPLLGVDMWEHAYYLQYNNVKADYLKEIWKIVNWKDVAARYSKAQ